MPARKTNFLRKVQRYIQHSKEQMHYRNAQTTQGEKITLWGILICGISLFLPWGSSFDKNTSAWANDISSFYSFSPSVGFVGFFVLIIILSCAFFLLSTKKKEQIRFLMHIRVSESLYCLCSGIIICILSLQSYFFIQWLKTFSANIMYEKWITLCLTGSIIMCIWSYILKSEYRKNIKWSYIHDSEKKEYSPEIKTNKDNMKFPF